MFRQEIGTVHSFGISSSRFFEFCFFLLIIFRLSVEVADFNFGETSSVDLEYKSFHRRLYDSMRELLPRRGYTSADDVEDSSLRYGTMT